MMNQYEVLNTNQRRALHTLTTKGPREWLNGTSTNDTDGLVELGLATLEDGLFTATDLATEVLGTRPEVGMGATEPGYTDLTAGTIVAVSANGKRVTFQEDTATLLNGYNSGEEDALVFTPGGFCGHTSGTQRYRLERNPEGRTSTWTLRKDGQFHRKGAGLQSAALRIGLRVHFHDYNF